MDYMEKEYGIKEDMKYYSVYFELQSSKDVVQVKGEILNFTPQQLVLKSDKGMFIIKPKNIVEMRPLFKATLVLEDNNE